MEIYIVSNNGQFEAVKSQAGETPLNCVLCIPNGKTWKNQYLLVKNKVAVSWQDYFNYTGYRVLKVHYKGIELFSAYDVCNPQVVIDILNRFNTISDEELETLYNEAQEKNKSNLELQIEELKAEKLKLQEQIKIFLEIQKKKEEIKDLMAKLE